MLENYSNRTWLKYSVLIRGRSVVWVVFVLWQVAAFLSTIFKEEHKSLEHRVWETLPPFAKNLLHFFTFVKSFFQKARITITVSEITIQSTKIRILSISLLAISCQKQMTVLQYFISVKVGKNVYNYEALMWYSIRKNMNPLHTFQHI